MTHIDFYILAEAGLDARQLFACRLIEKAFQLGHRIYVYVDTPHEAEQFDTLLWEFRANSFIPHELQTQAATSPVLIGHAEKKQEPGTEHLDVLINLAQVIPEFFSRFARISEIVIQDTAHKAITRDHYRFYQDRGYPLNNHKIGH